MKQIAHVQGDVLQAVAAQSAVEAQDQERGQHAHPAQPLELLGQDPVRADGPVTGFAAQSQLADHDDNAAEHGQHQIQDQEREAAVGTHLVGKAPDVAQADCRADGSH